MNRDGELVGIVTRTDLVRAFARPDSEIEREIREDVVRRTLWIDHDRNLEIRVHRGDVTLSGELERRTDAELLGNLVARVPGVVSVSSTLAWSWDDQEPSLDKDVPRGADADVPSTVSGTFVP